MGHSTRYLEAGTLTAEGANGVSYAYRRPGPVSGPPLVLLQHFRGNLENWDPSLLPDVFVKLYPGAAHGFLFQHAEEFAGDVLKFR
jgi:hypothetical protein